MRASTINTSLCALLFAAAAGSPMLVSAQEEPGVKARVRDVGAPAAVQDSAGLREEARKAQEQLEQFRESRIPPEIRTGGGRCDEMVGRMCFRFERDEDPIQPEPLELEMARRDLLNTLINVHRSIPGDGWVLGQLVFYLGEANRWSNALDFVNQCKVADTWWCDALKGYVLHEQGETDAAATEFGRALAGMPDSEAQRWHALDFVLDPDGKDALKDLDADQAQRARDYLWLMSDPLYLVPGNDRLTAHYARRTVVLIREKAANAFGLEWEDDLAQLTVRYGPEVGWERGKAPPGGGGGLTDTRHIIGRHHPKSIQYVPPEGYFVAPAEVPADSWELEKDRPRTGYAAPYALDVEGFDAQVARFRRGDSLLVVASWAPRSEPLPMQSDARRVAGRGDPFGNAPAQPPPDDDPFGFGSSSDASEDDADAFESALFLVTTDGEVAARVDAEDKTAVRTATVPNGEYIVSMEAWEPDASRAWRTRHGVAQATILPDLASVSDLLVMDGAGDLPETWEDAVPRTLPGVRVAPGDRVSLAWEVYGLKIGERASVTMGVTQGKPNLLRRLGQFLRVLEPDAPVVVSFEDAAADQLGTIFRSVRLDFPPELEVGEYTLHVEIELPGRTPMVISRRVLVG